MNLRGKLTLVAILGILISPLNGQTGDWRSELASLFLRQADWSEMISFLEPQFGSLDSLDKPTAALVLAFAFEKNKDRTNAYTWLARFFEEHQGEGAFFDFLPRGAQNEIWAYWRQWQARYPRVSDLSFLIPAQTSPSLSPPERFVLAIQMTNAAFFKLISEGETIKAGELQRGLNTLSLESSSLIRQSGLHAFLLDLKVDDLIIRREITIDVNLSSELVLSSPAASEVSRSYRVSLLLGEKLLAQSQSTIRLTPPVQLTLPPADGRYSPYGPVHPSGRDPNTIGVSILNLPLVLAQLIKDYKAKKDEKERVPAPETKKEIQVVYLNQTQKGLEKMTADLRLEFKGYQAMVFSASSP